MQEAKWTRPSVWCQEIHLLPQVCGPCCSMRIHGTFLLLLQCCVIPCLNLNISLKPSPVTLSSPKFSISYLFHLLLLGAHNYILLLIFIYMNYVYFFSCISGYCYVLHFLWGTLYVADIYKTRMSVWNIKEFMYNPYKHLNMLIHKKVIVNQPFGGM